MPVPVSAIRPAAMRASWSWALSWRTRVGRIRALVLDALDLRAELEDAVLQAVLLPTAARSAVSTSGVRSWVV